jgi:hypothetical protein
MRFLLSSAALLLGFTVSAPASACTTDAEIVFDDVKYADIVVVGEIANYKVVTPPGEKPGFLPDYARFDILVDEVLKGQVGKTLTVTWDNSTFGDPDSIPPGQYLIALRSPKSTSIPPLRGPSATILPRPEPAAPTLLQAACADPFMFLSTSESAKAVRKILQSSAH